MSDAYADQIEVYDVGDVIVARVLARELRNPAAAMELGAALNALVDADKPAKLLVNFDQTRYLSSTAFAVLVNLARRMSTAGAMLKLCGMDADILVGADHQPRQPRRDPRHRAQRHQGVRILTFVPSPRMQTTPMNAAVSLLAMALSAGPPHQGNRVSLEAMAVDGESQQPTRR